MMPRSDFYISTLLSDNFHSIQLAQRLYISRAEGLYSQLYLWERAVFGSQRTLERNQRKDLGFRASIIIREFSLSV